MVTREKIEEAVAAMDAHLGPGLFNKKGSACPLTVQELTSLSILMFTAGWEYILEKHGGRLPLRIIRAVPEGTIIPTKNGGLGDTSLWL